jgi:hypothetical protein
MRFHVSMVVEIPDVDMHVEDIETDLRQLADAEDWIITSLAVVPSD